MEKIYKYEKKKKSNEKSINSKKHKFWKKKFVCVNFKKKKIIIKIKQDNLNDINKKKKN